MKSKILKYLLENTELVNKASGGNDPSVISFKFSEEEDKETFLSRIAEEISATLEKDTESDLSGQVFTLANKLAIAGFGNEAVLMHTIHNRLIK